MFKKGDRVRYVGKTEAWQFRLNRKGTIIATFGDTVHILFDEEEGHCSAYRTSLEKIDDQQK